MQLAHPFEPVYDSNSKILILGSFPSVKSRETEFYYGHKQNRFWKVLSCLFRCEIPQTVEEKRQMLLKNRVAVWDILKNCEIEGSADSKIRNPVANDLSELISQTKIKSVFFNGTMAYQIYRKHAPQVNLPVEVLPSTSPANAAYRLDRLCEIWGNAILDKLDT